MPPSEIDFQALVPKTWDNAGITLVIRRAIRFGSTGGAVLAVDVGRRRLGRSGQDLKPEHVITILGNEDETVAVLLHKLTVAFEQPNPVQVTEG